MVVRPPRTVLRTQVASSRIFCSLLVQVRIFIKVRAIRGVGLRIFLTVHVSWRRFGFSKLSANIWNLPARAPIMLANRSCGYQSGRTDSVSCARMRRWLAFSCREPAPIFFHRARFDLFRNTRADRGQIDSTAPALSVDYRCDRRRGVPARAQLAAIEDDERLAGEVGQVGTGQLAQFRALVLKLLDQAGAFGLVRSEFPADSSAGGSAYPPGVKEAFGVHAR
jgi:hypothetical protein